MAIFFQTAFPCVFPTVFITPAQFSPRKKALILIPQSLFQYFQLRTLFNFSPRKGRNVAPRQFANQSSAVSDEDDQGTAGNVATNLRSTSSRFCSRTRQENTSHWHLTYNRPQIVTEIIVATRNGKTFLYIH